MQSKEKRKTNPRRRLLMRLIVVSVAIAIVLLLGLRALKPKGAQIVYIAPDDNGYDAIWLADLNDPENPRQLTFHEGMFIRDFQVSNENSIIFYSIGSSSTPMEFWRLNLDSNEHTNLRLCETTTCINFQLNHNGQWLAFEDYGQPSDRIYVYDLRDLKRYPVFDFRENLTYSHVPTWVGNTGSFVFRSNSGDENQFASYSVEENKIVETLTLNDVMYSLNFSPDGSLYTHPSTEESSTSNLRYSDDSSTVLYETISSPEITGNTYISGWYPDNNYVLISEVIFADYFMTSVRLSLYNFITQESDILLTSLDNLYIRVISNAEGTQLLYSIATNESTLRQFMLFDMETREEITLPIIGRNPQWVNGGR